MGELAQAVDLRGAGRYNVPAVSAGDAASPSVDGGAMPVYEYECQECGRRFDALRSMSQADAPIACQGCESQNTSRALSVFFASSGGKVIAGGNGGCGSCSGGSCSSCSVN